MKATVLLLLISSILFGCKKYEEGPALTFRTPEQRLTRTWLITRHNINGKEDTKNFVGFEEVFHKNGKYNRTGFNPFNPITTGRWEFTKDKSKIYITIDKMEAEPIVYFLSDLEKDELHYIVPVRAGTVLENHHYYATPKN